MGSPYQDFLDSEPFAGQQAAYLEGLLADFLEDPKSVPAHWQEFFRELGADDQHGQPRYRMDAVFRTLMRDANHASMPPSTTPTGGADVWADHAARVFRREGHQVADINPLFPPPSMPPSLSTDQWPVPASCWSALVTPPSHASSQPITLSQWVEHLRQAYTGPLSLEADHLEDQVARDWLYEQMETLHQPSDQASQAWMLKQLAFADRFEHHLSVQFVATKRFSLEGCDALIPLLNTLLHRGAEQGVEQVVLGMPHRGRLSTMVNVLGMPMSTMMGLFTGSTDLTSSDVAGDVKYHMGYAQMVRVQGRSVYATLMCNPSHLEIVGPVAMGSARARQVHDMGGDTQAVMPVVLHGDASITGQGVVAEALNFSKTRGFHVGGTVHVVVNNQIGFTTDRVDDARSSRYCTGVMKMVDQPILHVNADDVEAVVRAAELAVAYRQRFGHDITIDLVGYRRLGHNEADEPAATSPQLYANIRKHPRAFERYAERCQRAYGWSQEDVQACLNEAQQVFEQGQRSVEVVEDDQVLKARQARWKAFEAHTTHPTKVTTGVALETLQQLANTLTSLPEGFTCQRQVGNVIQQRQAMAQGERPLRWGFAELLAYASLLDEGTSVRLTGQDSERGTFGHRHLVLHDVKKTRTCNPLAEVATSTGVDLTVHNSPLSEEAVMAFEYGYSITYPHQLVLWEAQFGDFVNGAQVVIDQFLSAAWQKWQRMCGLVLLLPHGQEGMGPEHSSARLERFLQLSAQDNWRVCMPTMPSQIFHLLRLQGRGPGRLPLVVMSPKSLLRHPKATSSLVSLTEGHFATVLDDPSHADAPDAVTRVVLCSGKVYFDLLEQRDAQNLNHVALVRVEQLAPWPLEDVLAVLRRYTQATAWVWCQEEPKNQGAWSFANDHHEAMLARAPSSNITWSYAGQRATASTSVGRAKEHALVQADVVNQALDPTT